MSAAIAMVQAGGQPLACIGRSVRVLAAAVFVLTISAQALAQTPTWEALPFIRPLNFTPSKVISLGFLWGEGALADDPAADSLIAFTYGDGAFLYNPSGAAGAAGSNGEYNGWYELCRRNSCKRLTTGLMTSANTILAEVNNTSNGCRVTDRGRTWACDAQPFHVDIFHESFLPFPESTTGRPTLFRGSRFQSSTTVSRSFEDGVVGSWQPAPVQLGDFLVFADVPPSPMLPRGRLIAGHFASGLSYADDGGMTWTRANLPGTFFGTSLTFVPVEGHPYGGVALAGLENFNLSETVARAEVWRSDDGGTTWAFVHRFAPEEIGREPGDGAQLNRVAVYATPDGAVWAGVGYVARTFPDRGGILRSTDLGQTWQRADAGRTTTSALGLRVNSFLLSRDGTLYAATERGVERTTSWAVSSEAPAVPGVASLGVAVRPNPSSGRVRVSIASAEARTARVVVVDALGREVAVVLDGAVTGAREVSVDTSSWPAGMYVVRASAGDQRASARLMVAR